jgi:phospholipid/cholesterol/gamma-HCH transport system ATP-binding protein
LQSSAGDTGLERYGESSALRHKKTDVAIDLDGVSFTIGGHHVLEDVSFSIKTGSTVAIMGPSGIGKSTILRLILGLALPQKGDVRVFGTSIVKGNEESRNDIRKCMGMVFQNGALFDSLTTGENVGYGMIEHSKRTLDEIEPEVRKYIQIVGLNPEFVIDRLPDELSVGMQRRVAIARALAFDEPEIMLYDEPTTGLDPVSVEMITDVIVRLRRDLHVTSIVVSHEIQHALKVADRFLFLYDRRIAFEGNAKELAESREPALVSFLEPFKGSLELACQSFSVEGLHE